jgi:hypothetical protein
MVQGDGQISEAGPAAFADGSLSPRRRTRLSRDELLELAAWNGSMDIARIHTRPSPPPLHRLGA